MVNNIGESYWLRMGNDASIWFVNDDLWLIPINGDDFNDRCDESPLVRDGNGHTSDNQHRSWLQR